MKTVLMFSPNDLDGVSMYRHWGPMLQLEKEGHVKLVAFPSDSKQLTNWQYYLKCDFAFMSRPAKNRDYYFIKECQKYEIPVWIDIDDNIFQVTDDNDAYEYYSNDEAIKFAIFALRSAKVLTVATPRLQNFLKETIALSSTLIPNGIKDTFFENRSPLNINRQVLWRGGRSHLADLLYYENQLKNVIEQNPKYLWHFMGLNPFFISRKIKDNTISWEKTINYIDFMIKMKELRPSRCIVPLLNSEFNQTRSSNAWVEATCAGAVTMAPSWDEWKKPGIFNYSSNFDIDLQNFLELSEIELNNLFNESVQEISEKFILSKTNKLRIEIIETISA